ESWRETGLGAWRSPLAWSFLRVYPACTPIQHRADPARRWWRSPQGCMKVTINREALLAACRLAGRLLPEHPLSPVEEHFLLRTGEGAGSLRAAGPEAFLRLPLPLQIERPGEALLPARSAVAVLRAATADELSLEASAGSLLL